MQEFNDVTILSSPAGTPVSGSTNTFSYRILSSVTLTCDGVPSPTASTTIRWTTNGCTGCFPSNQTTQMVIENTLTPEDTGMFTCSLQEGSNESFSGLFTLVVDCKLTM